MKLAGLWATVSGLAETHQDIAETWTDMAQARTTAGGAAQRGLPGMSPPNMIKPAPLAHLRDQGKLPKPEWPQVDELASLAQKARRSGQ